MLKVIFFILKI